MHGLQRCFLFTILVIYGSVFGRSERIRTNQHHHRNNNRPTRSHRRYPSLLSFLSSVVAASGTSETSHVTALHRKLSVDDEDTDEDIMPASTPVPSLSSSKSSVKVDAKRDNVGHNASKKIQVAKSKKKYPTVKDTTVERAPSGAHIYPYLVPIHTSFFIPYQIHTPGQ